MSDTGDAILALAAEFKRFNDREDEKAKRPMPRFDASTLPRVEMPDLGKVFEQGRKALGLPVAKD